MKNLILLLLLSILFSCTSDDQNELIDESNNELTFTSYSEVYNRPEDNGIENFQQIKTGQIIDGKFQDYQFQTLLDNEILSENNFEEYVYDNGKLVSFYPKDEADDATSQDLFYDNENNLTGFYWERVDRYYQVIHEENNIDYFQILTGSFDDQNSEISTRYILEFDEYDNVIKAGQDQDLDGIMDYENKFSYDENNNLIEIELSNGETTNLSYTEIKNTKSYILDNSFGKRTRRLRCSELFGNSYANFDNLKALNISKNLSNDEVNASLELQTDENNFYTKRTIESDDTAQATVTMEFFTN